MLKTSVAKKIWMGISGLFLISFLVIHLSINLLLIYPGKEAFENAVHFMATNPFIRIMEPVLFLGFIFHILSGIWLEWNNRKKRPVGYNQYDRGAVTTWAAANMIWTGLFVLVFLVVHLINYWYQFKIVGVEDHYELVISLFDSPVYTLFYVLAFIALGVHLSHGFQSAFQSVGAPREKFHKCLRTVGYIFSFIIAIGFSIIAIYFYLK